MSKVHVLFLVTALPSCFCLQVVVGRVKGDLGSAFQDTPTIRDSQLASACLSLTCLRSPLWEMATTENIDSQRPPPSATWKF